MFNSAAQDYNEQYNLQVEPGCEERKMRVINVCLWESVNILGDLSQKKRSNFSRMVETCFCYKRLLRAQIS